MKNQDLLKALVAFSLFGLLAREATAASITPTNFDDLNLGALIVGPVGPEVETSLVDADNQGLGDLESGVFCPAGFTSCVPPENPEGTIYTFVHRVTPGVDFPNDPPFPLPEETIAFNEVTEFGLGFDASGFTGNAGFSFSEAEAALGEEGSFEIEQLDDGTIVWTVSGGEGWDTDTANPETVTFFWQTTQPPSGPGGTFLASNDTTTGSGAGPLPVPVQSAQSVPEPFGLLGLLAGLGAFATLKRKQQL